MVLLGEWVMSNLVSVHFETALVLVQVRCTVCAKRTINSVAFWMHLMELLGDVGHVEYHFGPFGVSVSVGES